MLVIVPPWTPPLACRPRAPGPKTDRSNGAARRRPRDSVRRAAGSRPGDRPPGGPASGCGDVARSPAGSRGNSGRARQPAADPAGAARGSRAASDRPARRAVGRVGKLSLTVSNNLPFAKCPFNPPETLRTSPLAIVRANVDDGGAGGKDRRPGAQFLLRRPPRARRNFRADSPQRGDRAHRSFRMRQVHLPADVEP